MSSCPGLCRAPRPARPQTTLHLTEEEPELGCRERHERGWWGGLTAGVEEHIPHHIGPCSHLCPRLLRTWRQKQGPGIGHCLQCPCLHCGPWTRPPHAPCPSHTSPPLTDVAWTSHPGCGAVRMEGAVTGLASVPLASNPARVQVPGQRAFSAHSIGCQNQQPRGLNSTAQHSP